MYSSSHWVISQGCSKLQCVLGIPGHIFIIITSKDRVAPKGKTCAGVLPSTYNTIITIHMYSIKTKEKITPRNKTSEHNSNTSTITRKIN